jgi:hypothetical protein
MIKPAVRYCFRFGAWGLSFSRYRYWFDVVNMLEHRRVFPGVWRITPKRQGFWLDEAGNLYVGYLASEENFHYMRLMGSTWIWSRSSAKWPEPALRPIDLREGLTVMNQILRREFVRTDCLL